MLGVHLSQIMFKRIFGLACLVGFACSTAFATQSVQVTSGSPGVTLPNAAPWTTIGQNTKSMRWEMRIHGFGADWPQAGVALWTHPILGIGVPGMRLCPDQPNRECRIQTRLRSERDSGLRNPHEAGWNKRDEHLYQ